MKQEKKNKVGRPRTTIDDLPEDWKSIVMDCGQRGGSEVEARCLLGISSTGWYTLLEDSVEFSETVAKASSLCQVWWEKNGQRLAIEGGGNATIWIFNMKNRFGWSDKQQIDQSIKSEPASLKIEMI